MSGFTTNELREDYIWRNRPRPSDETAAEFDEWLRKVESVAFAAGYADGYENGSDDGYRTGWDVGYESGYEGGIASTEVFA